MVLDGKPVCRGDVAWSRYQFDGKALPRLIRRLLQLGTAADMVKIASA
jgi:hypothetical protein